MPYHQTDQKHDSELFIDTHARCLEQIKGIDLASKAKHLGGEMIGNALIINIYGRPYQITRFNVVDTDGQKANPAISVVLYKYILQFPKVPPLSEGDWVTYREFENAGPLTGYFTQNTNKIIETSFAGRLNLLRDVCHKTGGIPVKDEGGFDIAVQFDFLPRVPVLFRFNDRDEDFPAVSSLLFRQSAQVYLDLKCLSIGGTLLTGKLIREI